MKILVLGAAGMAGHVMSLYLRENGYGVETLSAHHTFDEKTKLIDVTDLPAFKKLLDASKYDAVVNCIGVLVKQSEEKKDLAVYINSYLPHFLESYYKNSKTRVIHISTDDVFSFSSKHSPYQENSAYDGESFYGRSKALGEIINDKDLTFRMSIIGPAARSDGTGLFNWFYNQRGEMSGFTNAIWNGVTTIELAKATAAALKQDLTGLYHLVPKESISKFKLLELFKENFGREDVQIKPAEGTAVDKTLHNARKDFDYRVPDYKTMVSEMKIWIEAHPRLYKHYGN